MQTTAQAWLVLVLTHSATDLGIVIALQTLPTLLLGPYGGLIADRLDKRKLMVGLQTLMGVQAVILGVLTLTHRVTFVDVCILAVVLGLNNCFENPARQAFVLEMVGADNLRNAVSLNSTLVNAARAVGPAIAGVLIATVGEGWCFMLNAVSFAAVVFSLMSMDLGKLRPSVPTPRSKGQLRDGFRYVARTPELGIPLLMMGLVGMLAYEFQVTLPYAAKHVFHGGSQTFGLMTSAMGIGAIAGGLITAAIGKTGMRPMVLSAFGFGVVLCLAAIAPTLPLELVALARRRLRLRDVPRDGQLHAAARHRAADARTRDVALGRRLPRLDADRRTADRLDHLDLGRACRARRRSALVLPRGRARAAGDQAPRAGIAGRCRLEAADELTHRVTTGCRRARASRPPRHTRPAPRPAASAPPRRTAPRRS